MLSKCDGLKIDTTRIGMSMVVFPVYTGSDVVE